MGNDQFSASGDFQLRRIVFGNPLCSRFRTSKKQRKEEKKSRKEKKREREKRVDRGIRRLTMKRGARRCDCVRVCDWKWANF